MARFVLTQSLMGRLTVASLDGRLNQVSAYFLSDYFSENRE